MRREKEVKDSRDLIVCGEETRVGLRGLRPRTWRHQPFSDLHPRSVRCCAKTKSAPSSATLASARPPAAGTRGRAARGAVSGALPTGARGSPLTGSTTASSGNIRSSADTNTSRDGRNASLTRLRVRLPWYARASCEPQPCGRQVLAQREAQILAAHQQEHRGYVMKACAYTPRSHRGCAHTLAEAARLPCT